MKKILLAAMFVLVQMGPAKSDDLNVAFFLEWATPIQADKVAKTYDDVLGVEVNWTDFATGVEMTEAMLSGDIDIAYSQGMAPFVNAVNARAPIKMVAVAVAYGGANTDCIVRDNLGVDSSNATELEGQRVAVPLNTMADFIFRETMRVVGVDINSLEIVDMEPSDGAIALQDGNVAMACLFGGSSISRAKEIGAALLSAQERKDSGIILFDVVSATDKLIKERPEVLRNFLRVTHDSNARWATDKSTLPIIANDAGMKVDVARAQLDGFTFPSPSEQYKQYFVYGGLVNKALDFMGGMFATDQNPALGNYAEVVDTSFLD